MMLASKEDAPRETLEQRAYARAGMLQRGKPRFACVSLSRGWQLPNASQLPRHLVDSRPGVQKTAGTEASDLVARVALEEEALRAAVAEKDYERAASLHGGIGELQVELDEARRSESQAVPR